MGQRRGKKGEKWGGAGEWMGRSMGGGIRVKEGVEEWVKGVRGSKKKGGGGHKGEGGGRAK